MRVSRPDFAAAVAAQGCAQPSVHRLMRALDPLFRIAETGQYRLADESMLNQVNVAEAIARATLDPVAGLLPVSASGDSLRADCRREDRYDSFVAIALRRNRRDPFVAAHGAESLGRLMEPLWDSLGMAFTAALQDAHEGFLEQLEPALAADVAFGPMVAAAYAAGYVAYGDDAGFESMRGLIRLLPWVVPIGSPEGSGGWWLVLVE